MNDVPPHRDITIDTLRGTAVATMVAANLAGPILAEPHPFWVRVYGSFAAPLFIALAGMMVGRAAQLRKHTLRHVLLRAGTLIALGAGIDLVIWRIYPFMTFDVLYLIGLSLPVAFFFSKRSLPVHAVAAASLFLIAPIFQNIAGYLHSPIEIPLSASMIPAGTYLRTAAHQSMVDGWFPVIPWTGFALAGAFVGRLRWPDPDSGPGISFTDRRIVMAGLGLLLEGIIVWRLMPGEMFTRQGYSELFYPPNVGYCLTALGVIGTLLVIVGFTSSSRIYWPLQLLGRAPLTIYVLHLALIEWAIVPFTNRVNVGTWAGLYIALLALMMGSARLIQLPGKRSRREPLPSH